MKKITKILSLLFVLMLSFSLVACGSKKDSKDDTTGEASLDDIIPEETVTLNVYTQLANYSGEQIGWFGQVMKEKFNVVLNIINEGDGTFVTRMESGDLGDIVVFGNDADEYLQAINAGLLFDWEEDELVQDYGSYIWEHMQPALDKNRGISPDGTLYGFGHNVGTSATDYEPFFYMPDIRWDLYKELGYPEVNTLEDFIPLLEQMVELEPTSDNGSKTYGVSLFPDWDGDMVMMVKATGALYGYDEFGFGLYHVERQEYEDVLQEGGMYLRALKFYNTLYQKGLLDPDSMTQTYDDMSEAYQTGAAFFNIFDWMASGLYNTPAHKEAGKAMMPLAAKDQTNLTYGLNIYGANRVWTIGANTNYPELCMAIINWLSTPEGFMTMEWGPKGVIWDYNEEGKPYLTELGENAMSDGNTEMTDGYSGKYTDGTSKINNQTWARASRNFDASNGDPYNYSQWETYLSKPVSEIEQDWRDFTGALSPTEYLENNDHITISIGTTYVATPKSDELRTIWNQVAETVKTYSWRAIYAKTDAEFDSIVEEMRTKAFEYGYEQCVEYQQNEAEIRKNLENEAKAASAGN
ncbi:MAG: hypothetical protein GX359_08380 [Clostridiales bacterium]|nr:hypothetical protein [Clostridiales bacterium]